MTYSESCICHSCRTARDQQEQIKAAWDVWGLYPHDALCQLRDVGVRCSCWKTALQNALEGR